MQDLRLIPDGYTILVTGTVQEEGCDGLCWGSRRLPMGLAVQALDPHCFPADISGVSYTQGEVAASVFDRYRITSRHASSPTSSPR
jgi:hypothetical protein